MSDRAVSEQVSFVLAALAAGPLHGYAVLAEVQDLSERRVRLAVGTLYGILDRLAETGRIEVEREEIIDSRLRRYYRLTSGGRQLLEDEVARQRANIRVASRQLRNGVARPALVAP